ncbi:MAG: ABC transporter permease [Armatimonadota bacterium]|nr:ABC transporter permease [Armatimonadota bacterium]
MNTRRHLPPAGDAVPYLAAVAVAFGAVGIFLAALGFDVVRAYSTILLTSFRTANGVIQTLLKFVPVLLLALAFTVPLAAWKFNIGGEGQLIAGAVGSAAAGILLAGLPAAAILPAVVVVGVGAGALWAALPAWLLYRFGVSEILTTVLMNFVSFGVMDYVATEGWPDTAAGHPTTIPIAPAARLPLLVASPPLHAGILLALGAAGAVAVFVYRTAAGYELRATGANARAAMLHGIPVGRIAPLALVLGGALAGLAGAIEVAGVHHRLIEGVQSNYLLLSILVGLLARGNLVAVPPVAFAIAVLDVGARAMQRTMMIPVEVVFVVEGLVLVFVLLSDVVRRR